MEPMASDAVFIPGNGVAIRGSFYGDRSSPYGRRAYLSAIPPIPFSIHFTILLRCVIPEFRGCRNFNWKTARGGHDLSRFHHGRVLATA